MSTNPLEYRLIGMVGETVGLFLKDVQGVSGAATIPRRIPGQVVAVQNGCVDLRVTASPAGFPELNNRTFLIPIEQIVAVDKP